MADDLSREDEFLLKEYDAAVRLTFHVDELRSRFTNLFITISSAAAAGISLLLQGPPADNEFGQVEAVLAIMLVLVALVGIVVIAVIARLRRVQLEHFRITNNIRKYFLGNKIPLWNVVELSSETLPIPNRSSGTYFWSLVIMLINSYSLGLAIYLFSAHIWLIANPNSSFVIAAVGAIAFVWGQNVIYFRLAMPPAPRMYSKESPPI